MRTETNDHALTVGRKPSTSTLALDMKLLYLEVAVKFFIAQLDLHYDGVLVNEYQRV